MMGEQAFRIRHLALKDIKTNVNNDVTIVDHKEEEKRNCSLFYIFSCD